MRQRFFIKSGIMAVAFLISCSTLGGTVELHAHLFMKEGMSWMFRGRFDGPLEAASWKDRFSSQTNIETLDSSGNSIVVAALYAQPLLVLSVRDSIRRQADLAEKFVAAHPGWIIGRDPVQARQALTRGKKVLILSLEGAAGVLETDQDIEEFIDRRGIRIVTLLHLTDDEYGGVAFLRGLRALASPVALIESLFSRSTGSLLTNTNGLTQRGADITRRLLGKGVWIDLAHASDAAQRDLLPLLGNRPLLYTHTVLRSYFPAERALSRTQLQEIAGGTARPRGVLGLMPVWEMLSETPLTSFPSCAAEGGLAAFAAHYRDAVAVLGSGAVMLGSDWNGAVRHLPPDCLLEGLSDTGFANIGQTGTFWRDLRKLIGVEGQAPDQASRLIEAWSEAIKPPASGS